MAIGFVFQHNRLFFQKIFVALYIKNSNAYLKMTN